LHSTTSKILSNDKLIFEAVDVVLDVTEHAGDVHVFALDLQVGIVLVMVVPVGAVLVVDA